MKKPKQPPKQPSALLAKMLATQPSQPVPAQPNIPQLFAQAQALYGQGKLEEAKQGYQVIINIQPNHTNAMTMLGTIYFQQGQFEAGVPIVQRSLQLNNAQPEAYSNLGNALNSLNRHEEAIANYDRAIALKPDYAGAYSNRGIALQSLNRHEEAIASYDRAIALKPDYAEAYYNRSNPLHSLNRHEEALASYDHAIALKPDYADAYSNRGNALHSLNRHEEALASYDRAIALKPGYAEVYHNKSLPLLLLGDFLQGWLLYEWRWESGSSKNYFRNFPQPLWLGDQSLAGKTLLLHAEQSFGDTLQFCRYVALVDALVKRHSQLDTTRIVLEVQPPLLPLLASLKTKVELVAQGQALPAFDLQCPLMSLPLAFHTTLETIPTEVPYLFADTDRQAIWQQRLGSKIKPRIGLVWSGSTIHTNDHNRSIPLSLLEKLTMLDAEFHSLQKEIRDTDQQYLAQFNITAHAEQLTDFAETAALVAEMDLIISVDTSVAHLAGAMGRPVWVLLPFAPDWRWLLNRTDSPWYPTARLFRQPAIGDWEGVMVEVAGALAMQFSVTMGK